MKAEMSQMREQLASMDEIMATEAGGLLMFRERISQLYFARTKCILECLHGS